MKKTVCFLAACFIPLTSVSYAQVKPSDLPGKLEKMFTELRQNLHSEEKLAVNDSINSIIGSYAASDTVFLHRFNNIRYLGQVTSPDSLAKLITWNLVLDDGENSYFCYVIKRDKKIGGGKVTKLAVKYNELSERSDTTYTDNNWYGALYYDIRPFISQDTTKYLLLGIDYGNIFVTRKLIDVLTFKPDGGLIFGCKCFFDGKISKYRVVFKYSAKAVMSLKFESDKLVVFDHLSPSSPEYRDNRQYYGPDFSFDSYVFENGSWRYRGDIDIKNK